MLLQGFVSSRVERLQKMLKQNPVSGGQDDMFRSRLDQMIDPRHELVKLSRLVDWDGLASTLSVYYCADIALLVLHGVTNQAA